MLPDLLIVYCCIGKVDRFDRLCPGLWQIQKKIAVCVSTEKGLCAE